MVFTGGPCTTGPGSVVGLALEESIRTHRVCIYAVLHVPPWHPSLSVIKQHCAAISIETQLQVCSVQAGLAPHWQAMLEYSGLLMHLQYVIKHVMQV